jgi:hypothetical protein
VSLLVDVVKILWGKRDFKNAFALLGPMDAAFARLVASLLRAQIETFRCRSCRHVKPPPIQDDMEYKVLEQSTHAQLPLLLFMRLLIHSLLRLLLLLVAMHRRFGSRACRPQCFSASWA